jgi:spectinomycin phosphotransferase
MREKPDLQESDIQECLFHQYGLRAAEIVFLPRGGDYDAAVYQVIGGEGAAYFLKLRRERGPGRFTDLPLRVADFLSGSGILEIIAPVRTIRGGLSTALGEYTAVVYPFAAGANAFETPLTGQQWVSFGRALRKVHSARIPAELRSRLKRETYAPTARERVNAILDRAEKGVFHDPVADQYAGFLVEKAGEIRHIVQKAGELAAVVQAQQPRLVLCHSDLRRGRQRLVRSARSKTVLSGVRPGGDQPCCPGLLPPGADRAGYRGLGRAGAAVGGGRSGAGQVVGGAAALVPGK